MAVDVINTATGVENLENQEKIEDALDQVERLNEKLESAST